MEIKVKVRGRRNPFVVVGHESCTSSRWKCTPVGVTRFQAGDTVVCLTPGDGSVEVQDVSGVHKETWSFSGVWTGI